MGEFNKVTYLYGWCQKIIPLVYDDSLSYYEQLCKVREKLNEVITNTNMIPDMIKQEVQDFINSGQIEEMIEEMLTGYLQRIVVNVVVPPQGIAPAKGNGNDDTETFQQCIDYLAENGGGLLFIPDGDWMVKPLTIKNGVYIAGASVSTKITLIGGSSAGLISGTVTDCGISELTLSNNAAQQTVDKAVIDIICNNITMDNLIVKNGYMGVNVTVNNGALIRGIRIDTLGYGGLYVNGSNADVSVSEVTVKNVSMISGQFGVNNHCDRAVYNHIAVYGPLPTGFSNNGASVTLKNAMIVRCDTGIFNVGDDCDFNALVDGNTEIINDAGKRTSYNFKGQNSQRKIGENVLNLGMTSPLMYRTPVEFNQFFNSVPAQDFSGNPYQILVPGENIDKIGQGVALKLSEIENKTAAGINAAIAEGVRELLIDDDLTLDAPILPPSNFKIIGAGGIITASTPVVEIRGSVGTQVGNVASGAGIGDTTLTGNLTGVSVGDTVLIKGTTDLFDPETSYEYRLGTGTAGAGYAVVYAGVYAKITGIGAGTFTIDTPLPWAFGGCLVYSCNLKHDVTVDGLEVNFSSDTLQRGGLILTRDAENCVIKNCRITMDAGSAICVNASRNVLVTNNKLSISSVWNQETDHASWNLIRVLGAYNVEICNNGLFNGTQNIDVTYEGYLSRADANIASYYVFMHDNVSHSNYSGITMHPGTFRCTCANNQILCNQGNGIQFRGANHVAVGNNIRNIGNVRNTYGIGFVEGWFRNSSATGNYIQGFQLAFEFQESASDTRDISYAPQWNVSIVGNNLQRCAVMMHIVRSEQSTQETVQGNVLFAANNCCVGNSIENFAILKSTHAAGKTVNHISIFCNNFLGFTAGNYFRLDSAVRFIRMAFNNFGSSAVTRDNDGTYSFTDGSEEGTYGTALAGTPALPSALGGSNPPSVAVVGQLYYDSNVLKVWNGSAWIAVS